MRVGESIWIIWFFFYTSVSNKIFFRWIFDLLLQSGCDYSEIITFFSFTSSFYSNFSILFFHLVKQAVKSKSKYHGFIVLFPYFLFFVFQYGVFIIVIVGLIFFIMWFLLYYYTFFSSTTISSFYWNKFIYIWVKGVHNFYLFWI